MRILKISDVYFPRVNGVSTSIRTFAHELTGLGHAVTLIAPAYPGAYDTEFEIVRVPSRYLPFDPEDRLMRTGALRRAFAGLEQRRFDLIHIHTPFAAHYQGVRLGHQLGIPIVETYHTYFEEYLDKYIPWLPRAPLRLAARHFSRTQCAQVDHLVVPTQPMLDVLRDYGIATPASIVPTGIPLGAFTHGNGARFRATQGIPATRPMLLYVGRVAHEKNIDFLLEVARHARTRVPDLLLVIAGEGPARPHLETQVHTLGLHDHIRFVGYLSRDGALADCYAAADVFVFASATETQGLVLLEAMQAGTPVVTTAVLGTAAVMADGTGGLVAGEDVVEFSAAVTRVLTDAALHNRLAAEARHKADIWSARATTARLVALYQQLHRTRQEATRTPHV